MDNERLVVQPRTCQMTCPGELVCFYCHYFLFFIIKYNIKVLHDYDDDISDIGQRAVSGEQPRTRQTTCPKHFLFFITKYNIQVLHDYDDGNKQRRRVWTMRNER